MGLILCTKILDQEDIHFKFLIKVEMESYKMAKVTIFLFL